MVHPNPARATDLSIHSYIISHFKPNHLGFGTSVKGGALLSCPVMAQESSVPFS